MLVPGLAVAIARYDDDDDDCSCNKRLAVAGASNEALTVLSTTTTTTTTALFNITIVCTRASQVLARPIPEREIESRPCYTLLLVIALILAAAAAAAICGLYLKQWQQQQQHQQHQLFPHYSKCHGEAAGAESSSSLSNAMEKWKQPPLAQLLTNNEREKETRYELISSFDSLCCCCCCWWWWWLILRCDEMENQNQSIT